MSCIPQKLQSKINRDAAFEKGEKVYESVTPCKKCNSTQRYVSSYGCVKCNLEINLKKLYDSELMGKYKTKAVSNAKTYRYRGRKKNQMPEDADHEKIIEFYKEAERLTEETGVVHHVDHIIPLSKGGLHHHNNLQVLTKEENLKKGNKIL